ncbi:hypothetical protein C4J81_12170 [Deltaproteobacteria bacterium Smac51]|nr:hypothetical protein C4J81_12170 [Deltaproteobacteria bacterium Smac51]
MTSSEAPSKSKGGRGRLVLIIVAVIFLALAALGPTLTVKGTLAWLRLAGAEHGLEFSYDEAGAGLLFSSITIKGLHIERCGPEPDLAPLSIGLLRLESPSFVNLIRLAREPETFRQQARRLAGGLIVENFEIDNNYTTRATLKRFSITSPALPANGQTGLPLMFESLMAEGLKYEDLKTENNLELGRLEARNADGNILAALRIDNLEAGLGSGGQRAGFGLGALTAGGVNATALERMMSSDNPLNLLMFCDTLDLAHGVIEFEGVEMLRIRKAVFDLNESDGKGPGPVTYRRSLDFTANLAALARHEEALQEPVFLAMREAGGDSLDFSLNLKLDYTPAGGGLVMNNFLESPALGRIDLNGRLNNVSGVKSTFTPYQLLFSSESWLLERLSLSYRDSGFMPAFYRALDQTIFSRSPRRQSAVNIMDYYVTPLAETVERENGLTNLPAVVSETRAFLNRPENFILVSSPLNPVPVLSLVKQDKYDIIDKLNLSVQVNDRAPVTVTAAKGVNHEFFSGARSGGPEQAADSAYNEEDI